MGRILPGEKKLSLWSGMAVLLFVSIPTFQSDFSGPDTKKIVVSRRFFGKMCYKFRFAVNRKFDQSVELVEMK